MATAADQWCCPLMSHRYNDCSSPARRCLRRTRCLDWSDRWIFCSRSDWPLKSKNHETINAKCLSTISLSPYSFTNCKTSPNHELGRYQSSRLDIVFNTDVFKHWLKILNSSLPKLIPFIRFPAHVLVKFNLINYAILISS